jgi:predicted house-cleaning noncanonical NTP pyrophosphatase (MazG superfamily)
MRHTYNKLVRDHIPEIINAEGRECATEVMSEEDYAQALLDKLVEEAEEVRIATPEKRATELADLLEVFDALLQAQNLNLEEVKTIQERRRAERGGFVQRLKLLWTE